ncbi:TlpA family protein disulfide reductase [Flavobacterium sp.]|uniref:TlpA family protein disulfide reductase n=1 Tax=Flavobacterium sp. TaxID=239 RepID=UPI0037505F34
MKVKIYFISLLLVLYYTNLIGRMHGIYFHYIVTGIVNFILTFLLLKINPFKKTGLFLIILPLFLLTPSIILGFINFIPKPGFIGHFMYLISTFFGFLLSKRYNAKLIILYSLIYFSLVYNFDNINNYYYYKMSNLKNGSKNFNFHNVKLSDKFGKSVEMDKDKVYLIDLWALNCAICIQNFPEFQKVKNYYSLNKNVEVITVNISDSKDEIDKSEKIIKKFNFNNYYTNRDIFKNLKFNSIPQYLIVNKKGEIKYFGTLNIKNNESFNNFYKLVNNEL